MWARGDEGAKLPPALTDDVDELALRRLPRRMPTAAEKRTLRDRLADLAATHVRDVGRVVRHDQKGARDRWIRRFTRACGLGHLVAGIPEDHFTEREMLFMVTLGDAELAYADRFARSVADSGVTDSTREGLYAGAMFEAFYVGWLAALPPDTQIAWRLSVAENCPDCLALGADSPYSKPGYGRRPLPTLPRAGDTRCLANCRCWLTAVGNLFESQLAPDLRVEIDGIGGRDVPVDAPEALAAVTLYAALVGTHVYRLRRAAAQPDQAAVWDRLAEDALQEIEFQARAFHHRLRLGYTRDEAVGDVVNGRLIGLGFVPHDALSDDLIGLAAGVLTLRGARVGRVQAVRRNPPGVVLEGHNLIELSPESGNLLFVRPEAR